MSNRQLDAATVNTANIRLIIANGQLIRHGMANGGIIQHIRPRQEHIHITIERHKNI